MVRNYLKTALRNFKKNKFYTIINILGLSIGMASVVLIILFIRDELSFDKFHKDAGNIYRIGWFSGDPQTRTPHPMAQAMVRDFPEVESAVSFTPLWGPGLTRLTFSVNNPEKDVRFDEKQILAVDSTFFEVFSFNILKGDRNALKKPNLLLIGERMAKKYFGEDDPLGKFLNITWSGGERLIEVAAIFEDVPANAHFHFDFLISYVTTKQGSTGEFYTWTDFGHFNYIKLAKGADPKILESKLLDWGTGYMSWLTPEVLQGIKDSKYNFKLQPLTDIHLKSNIRWELEPNGNIDYVYIMSAAAIFILIIACVNFMNLTSAKSTERAKEIGVRKTLGAVKIQLLVQFLGESIMLSVISIILAGLMIEISMPFFNEITGKQLTVNYLEDQSLILIMVGIAIFIGFVSGFYPALILSSTNSDLILKGEYSTGAKGNFLRKSLVVFQFAVSMFLITGSIVIFNQLDFLRNKNLGFNRDQVVIINIKDGAMKNNFETLKNELLKNEGVVNVSAVSNVPGWQFNQNPIWEKSDDQNIIAVSEFRVDYDIFPTLGIDLIDGRVFSKDHPTDSATAFIINRTAQKALDLSEAVGKEIIWDADGTFFNGTIIGVVEDFHFQSLHQPIRPLIFQILPQAYNHVLLKINTSDFQELIFNVEETWTHFDNKFAFEFSFLDQTLDAQYRSEVRMGKVFGGFSLLAIIIATMGLFGLASLSFANRVKEVSIRKVFGAPSWSILLLLIKGFTWLVLIAILLGVPIAWMVMTSWLQNFNFKIDLNPMIFIISGLGILILAWFTVGLLTLKTANANPVDTLRNE